MMASPPLTEPGAARRGVEAAGSDFGRCLFTCYSSPDGPYIPGTGMSFKRR